MNKRSRHVINYRIRIKQRLIEYKGGKCQRCGYNKPISGAYHFHHRNPKEKLFSLGGCSLGYARQKQEADKCDLLCSNCHIEVHDEMGGWAAIREQAFLKRKPPVERECKQCSKEFLPKRKEQLYCCRKCQHLSMKKNTEGSPLVGEPAC